MLPSQADWVWKSQSPQIGSMFPTLQVTSLQVSKLQVSTLQVGKFKSYKLASLQVTSCKVAISLNRVR